MPLIRTNTGQMGFIRSPQWIEVDDNQPAVTARPHPIYSPRVAEMIPEAEADTPIPPPAQPGLKFPSLPSGRKVMDWINENKTAVYLGAATLFVLALMKRR